MRLVTYSASRARAGPKIFASFAERSCIRPHIVYNDQLTFGGVKPMAKAASKTTRSKKVTVPKTDDGQPIYQAEAARDAYVKGDVVFFPKVRNWLGKGVLVEAFGKVVNAGLFDNEAPYIEVNFDDCKKLNKVDLGKDIRKFLLELK